MIFLFNGVIFRFHEFHVNFQRFSVYENIHWYPYIIEGSLNSKLPTIWTVEKPSRVVKSAETRCNSAKVRRKKIHPRQMLEKSRNAVFFQWFVCRVSRKEGLLKRRVRSHVVRGEIKNCTRLWRKAHFEVKMLKNWRCRSTFWSSDVEKLHAAVAKSTFSSQNVQNTSVSDRFFEVLMSKNCTPLWRKAHFQVKMYKTRQFRTTFWSSDVEKLHAAVAKSTFSSQNVQNTSVSDHFLKFWFGKIAHRCGEKHIFKSKCTKHVSFGPLFEVLMSKN